jgi:fatty-acyl-CoA synthase
VRRPDSHTIPDLLDELAARQPGHELVVDQSGQARWSYAETRARARDLARGLVALGVRRGDRVALLMTNRPEWLVIDFAVTLLGATLVPISTWSRPRELEYVLGHCAASVLFTMPRFGSHDYLRTISELGGAGSAVSGAGSSRLPELRQLVVCGAAPALPPGALPSLDAVVAFGRGVPDAALADAQRAVAPEDIGCILYTSGTTSAPKGVQLAQGGLIENMWHIGERQHLTPADRMWMGISLFWSFGCANALFAVMTHGGTVVLQEHMEPGAALALIERERCTVYYGTPNIALALTEHPDRTCRW